MEAGEKKESSLAAAVGCCSSIIEEKKAHQKAQLETLSSSSKPSTLRFDDRTSFKSAVIATECHGYPQIHFSSVSPRHPLVRVQWREALEQTSPGPVFQNLFAKAPYFKKSWNLWGEMSCGFVRSWKRTPPHPIGHRKVAQSILIDQVKGPKLQNVRRLAFP